MNDEDNGSSRFRLPAVTSKEGTEFVTTFWPADTEDTVVVHKLLFVSVIARMVRFKPATARGEPQDMLVVWCNCRYYKHVVLRRFRIFDFFDFDVTFPNSLTSTPPHSPCPTPPPY